MATRCDSTELLRIGYFYFMFSAHFPVLIENIFIKHSELYNLQMFLATSHVSPVTRCYLFIHLSLSGALSVIRLCTRSWEGKREMTVLLISLHPLTPPTVIS